MSIRGILFDMDGTLLDTERLHYMAWREAANIGTDEEWESFFNTVTGHHLPYVKEQLGKFFPNIHDVDAVHVRKEEICRQWMEKHGVPVLPGVYHTFGVLASRDIKQCICTSTGRKSAEETLLRAGLLQRLDGLMCGDDITQSKPDPQIFLLGAKKLGLDIRECAVVEDAPAGIEAGLRSGACVFIVPGLLKIPEKLEKRCIRLHSLWELPEKI